MFCIRSYTKILASGRLEDGLPSEKRMRGFAALVIAAQALGAAFAPPASEVEIHYAPAENLERVDVALLRSAHTNIDMAAYSLTDWPVIDANRRSWAGRHAPHRSRSEPEACARPPAGNHWQHSHEGARALHAPEVL
jgi:hypothetical protein